MKQHNSNTPEIRVSVEMNFPADMDGHTAGQWMRDKEPQATAG
jgi:hypothetical protein